MTLDTALRARLRADANLAAILAVWNGLPAVFPSTAVPPDTDPGWAKDGQGQPVQYPRIAYLLDLQQTAAQILAGTLHLWLFARDGVGASLDDVEADVLASLSAGTVLYSADQGLVTVAPQLRTPIVEPTTRVRGAHWTFSVLGAPTQTTYAPDPIASLNRACGVVLDSHIATAEDAWQPTDANPGLYWRLLSLQAAPEDQWRTVTWYTLQAAGHVFAASPYARQNWARLVLDSLLLPNNRNIALEDGSPLRVQRLNLDLGANPFTQGQLRLEARFGLLASQAITTFSQTPSDPNAPAPVPTYPTPTYSPQPAYVSNVDTGQPLDNPTLEPVIPG